ncbi:uncharacterized protein LOC121366804, partial [Gigantopelta aegis]|uniref:uncharacterized protein LOC121366804 n=1 Tax=Gigantopelta aegis TaxID=1735272 RepID=UPI001B88BF51
KDSLAGIGVQEVEVLDMVPDMPPPPVPDANRIPYATPPIPEDDELKPGRAGNYVSRRKTVSRPNARRTSLSNVPMATTLSIPQLDAIQRSQKLLDVRLQHLQASSKENNRIQDDVEFVRKLMTENQKALCNVVQALSNIQGEIVNLAQCLKPTPNPPPKQQQANAVPNAHSNAVGSFKGSIRKRSDDDNESKV